MSAILKENLGSLGIKSKDIDILQVVHRACVISFCGASIYALYTIFVQKDLMNFFTTSAFSFIFLLEIILYKFKLIEPLKILVTFGVPMLIAAETIFIGGDFSQSAAMLACLAAGFILFSEEKKKMYTIGGISIIVHIAVLLYVEWYGPLFVPKDDPYDEIVVLIVSASWLYFILNKHDSDNKLLIQTLERKNISLLAATEELERFTHIASHDLKSPLRNIASFLGLIERKFKRGDTTDLLTNLEFARHGAIQMHSLIEGILEISKVNHVANSNKEIVDLNLLLHDAIDNLQNDIQEKNAIIYSASLPHTLCSPFEMTLLFQNLIENGIKYNQSARPTVEIYAIEEAGFLKIKVTDNGIGIEEQYHSYIFEHFKRLHVSTEYKGTGLGLSLCRKIVQKHGGDIQLQSELGQGSTFTAVFPLKTTTN